MSEWTTVVKKRRRHQLRSSKSGGARRQQELKAAGHSGQVVEVPMAPANESDVAALRLRVDKVIASVERLQFTSILRSALLDDGLEGTWGELVCYGVGSLATSAKARVQFALAEILRRELQFGSTCCLETARTGSPDEARKCSAKEDAPEEVAVPSSPNGPRVADGNAWYFDPVISPLEDAVWVSYGWQRIEKNEEGKRRACGDTRSGNGSPVRSRGSIFFMPHCPFRLYSNVLWANWTTSENGANEKQPRLEQHGKGAGSCRQLGDHRQLSRVLIVGNSFGAYDRRMMSDEARNAASNCVLRAARFVDEVPLEYHGDAGNGRGVFVSLRDDGGGSGGGGGGAELSTTTPVSAASAKARDAEMLQGHGTGVEAFADLAVMRWDTGDRPEQLGSVEAESILGPQPPEEFGVSHGGIA